MGAWFNLFGIRCIEGDGSQFGGVSVSNEQKCGDGVGVMCDYYRNS
jgi:hypothetical protein